VVTNLDDNGNPIAGETATKTAAYTYQRAALRAPATESLLVRTVAEVVFAFRRQILPNSVFSTSVDFALVGESSRIKSSVPLLVLSGPRLEKDPIRNSIEREDFRDAAPVSGVVDTFYPMATYSLGFDITALSNNLEELTALAQATLEFFRRTPIISVDIDASDPSKGRHAFEIELTEPLIYTIAPSGSDARSFAAGFELYDFPVELPEPVFRTSTVTQLERQVQVLGAGAVAETLVVNL
jgi:hypothetical protein